MREEIDRWAMSRLSLGHLAVDFTSGAVPALLPFFATKFDLSYTETAVLMLAVLVSSSLVQPLFGLWSDARGAIWLLPAGIALAGVGIASASMAPSYALVALLVFVAGIGIAAYHPEGAKFAAFASGRRRASGMSYFNIGGNTGYALAPIILTPLVLWLGLAGGALATIPVFVVAAIIFRSLPALERLTPAASGRTTREGEDDLRAMGILSITIVLRGAAWFALLTFVPLWVVADGGTKGEGGRVLALMLVAGAIGTLVLGWVADRIGLRRTLIVTQGLIPFGIVAFVAIGGVLGTIALMVVGLCTVGTFGVTMVLSQFYLPRHVGMASGLTVGLAMGIGGIAAVALGAVADAIDLQTAFYAAAVAPALGCVACLFLPRPSAWSPTAKPASAGIV
ncbi:MFS transporter [Gaiella sp.]|jgi:FSR family fosmidomycin resistance protein-like MFS transporter|uniref:MFS transporter n=1 Tax=Gaiella sp. TaxID=2663207 RepID=UPI002E33E6DA|nr:MFS transporter [Gaiella sp.]HEX5583302.1 MFS transporter [Gaiella sp.]